MTFDKFSLNGEVRPITEANISIFNIEYSYGFGVYETIRVINGTPYFLEQHSERLLASATIIGLAHPYSAKSVAENVHRLAKELSYNEVYNLKVLLIGGKSEKDCLLYIFPSAPLFPEKKIYRDGVRLISIYYERQFPEAKTLNMLGSYLAFKKARASDYYDALTLDQDGYITEGTATNFFLVKDKAIFMPPKGKILEGVTMRIILSLAMENGFAIKEKNVKLGELPMYDGAFLTSTSSKVLPIQKIDDHLFGPIPESVRVIGKLYDNFLTECNGIFDSTHI